jgi:hypothetical protein
MMEHHCVMVSANGHAILAQNTCIFYGRENCKVVGTLHNIVGNTGWRGAATNDDMNSFGAQTF